MQTRVATPEFLLFIYLRATYMLAFLCRIPFNNTYKPDGFLLINYETSISILQSYYPTFYMT